MLRHGIEVGDVQHYVSRILAPVLADRTLTAERIAQTAMQMSRTAREISWRWMDIVSGSLVSSYAKDANRFLARRTMETALRHEDDGSTREYGVIDLRELVLAHRALAPMTERDISHTLGTMFEEYAFDDGAARFHDRRGLRTASFFERFKYRLARGATAGLVDAVAKLEESGRPFKYDHGHGTLAFPLRVEHKLPAATRFTYPLLAR